MRTLLVLALAVVLLVLQSALHTLVPGPTPVPALALLGPLYLGLSPRFTLVRAVVLGFLCGYAFDLVSGTRVGVHTLAMPLLVLAASLLGTRLRVRGSISRAVVAFFLTALFALLVRLASRLAGVAATGGARTLLLEAAWTAAVAPLVFSLFDRVERRFDPSAVRMHRPSGERYDTGIELRR